ncbi:MAG: mercury methylation corrinoid protein HgcA, partial [Dethiobacteria bacterium]|nr:mercury methylation corrinoid protein HgcA [Dethiobacteria bacterium]
SLRKELKNQNLWVLVIDTKGINVWCAAGKGSFGTAEVIRMVKISNLAGLVSHRTLILPQLSAPGVAAHEVRRQCGFKVIYGPVRAADIPAFLAAGNKAEPAMRRTEFKLRDRLVLAPVEIAGMFKPLLILAAVFFLLNLASLLLAGHPFLFMPLLAKTLADLLPFFVATLVGIVMVPALLPHIPGRALAWKGWVLGIIWASFYILLIAPAAGWLQISAYLLGIPAITAFLGMNFTGSTTYTSLSGVVKEMGIALPLIIASAALGLIGLIAAYFV